MSDIPELRTILILAANPKGTSRLRLDEEVRKIEQALERAKKRDRFKLVQKWAVTDDDLRRALLDHEPEIVHFSGHGAGKRGLVFEGDVGESQPISGESLADLFRLCASHLKCVVLNACFSQAQAKIISQHINYVIGMEQEIGDEAAIKFALGFYDALGAGREIKDAYNFGCNAIDLKSIPENLTPVLIDNLKPKHFLTDKDDVSQKDEYARLTFHANSDSKHIFIRPDAFGSVGAVLDEIFIHYLAKYVPPYTYGSQWLLMMNERYLFSKIAVPIEWVDSSEPVHNLKPSWYETSLSQIGITSGSSWEIVMDKSMPDQVVGILTNSPGLVDSLVRNAKAYAFLISNEYLIPSKLGGIDLSGYRFQLVFNDWLSTAKDYNHHLFIDNEKPLAPEHAGFIKPW